jgi:hypothetical protein
MVVFTLNTGPYNPPQKPIYASEAALAVVTASRKVMVLGSEAADATKRYPHRDRGAGFWHLGEPRRDGTE